MAGLSVFQKIWNDHIVAKEGDRFLIYIDRHLVHEVTSPIAFSNLKKRGLTVRRSDLTLATVDHNVPTTDRAKPIDDKLSAQQIEALRVNAKSYNLPLLDYQSPLQGIVHVVGPELGFVLPGVTVACGDSHTSTNGALGALGFGVGTSEIEMVLATQSLWLRKPATMLVEIRGSLRSGVTPKDVALNFIGRVGVGGCIGYAVEYGGPLVEQLSVEERMTLANLTTEAGGRTGIVSPDEKSIEFVYGKPYAPQGEEWDRAVNYWKTLKSDGDAEYDKSVDIGVSDLEPQVTWGTDPSMVCGVSERIPNPEGFRDQQQRRKAEKALEYMGLKPGTRIDEINVDAVFIGSCTNARLGDLIQAARVVVGRRVSPRVKAIVVPGSQLVKRRAERLGLHRVFIEAGFEWRNSGCSLCLGMNSDRLAAGTRCVSTSNRNFENRQGFGVRTHLTSPIMAAAAALEGRFIDARELSLDNVGIGG